MEVNTIRPAPVLAGKQRDGRVFLIVWEDVRYAIVSPEEIEIMYKGGSTLFFPNPEEALREAVEELILPPPFTKEEHDADTANKNEATAT